jgi:RNA polymerase sigma-70 factor (ECF subfamily)
MNDSFRTRLRAGDPAAFTEAFREHADAVHRHALWATGDRAAAEDVVSLTFLEAWRHRERLRPEEDGGLRPWLLGIAVNVLRNTARSARRHQRALARLPRADTVPDFAEEVTGRIADAERLAAARAALDGLRRAEREVFTLCVWDGLDYAAAAVALGVPVGTVRSRLSRARAKLRLAAGPPARQPRTGRRAASGDGQSATVEPAPGSGHVGGEGGRTGRRNQHTPVTQENLA